MRRSRIASQNHSRKSRHGGSSSPQAGDFGLTLHAQHRILQRGLDLADVEYTIAHGKRFYRQGLIFCIMLDKRAWRRGESVRNMVVLLTHDGRVVTAYKEKNALKKIKRAVKYDLKEHFRQQGLQACPEPFAEGLREAFVMPLRASREAASDQSQSKPDQGKPV